MAERKTPRVRTWKTPQEWLGNNVLAAAAIAGGLCYLLVFEFYRDALRPFGVIPAEVGIDYTTAVWPVAQTLVIAFVVYVVVVLFVSERKVQSLGALLVVGPLTMYVAYFEEVRYVDAVREGRQYAPFISGRVSLLNALRADVVQIAWKESGPATTKAPLPSGKVLLLGMSGGIAIFYAVDSATTWRLSASDLVISNKAVFPVRWNPGGGGPGERP